MWPLFSHYMFPISPPVSILHKSIAGRYRPVRVAGLLFGASGRLCFVIADFLGVFTYIFA